MADIDWDDVVAHAPELSVVSSGAQTDILAYVNETVDEELFGGETAGRTKMARVLLACHGGAMAVSAGVVGSGALTAESAGGLQRSYSAGVASTALSLGNTSYGQSYLQLVNASAARAPFVI